MNREHSLPATGRCPSPSCGRLTLAAALAFACLLAGAPDSFAQAVVDTQNTPDSGLRGEMRVDPATLALGFRLSLGSYPGRAGTSLPVDVSYSSKVWRIDFRDITGQTIPRSRAVPRYAEHSASGWTTSLDVPTLEWLEWQPYDASGSALCASPSCPPPDPETAPLYVYRLLAHMPDGSTHELRCDDTPTTAHATGGNVFHSVDGSRMRYEEASDTLYLPDGSRYEDLRVPAGGVRFVDRNGNTLAYDRATKEWADTLGRKVGRPPLSAASPGDVTYSIPGVNGAELIYTFRWRYLSEALTAGGQELRFTGDRTLSTPMQTLAPSLFNLTKRRDARGTTAAYGYDALNRNITISHTTAGTGAAVTPDVRLYYDQTGPGINGFGRLWRSEKVGVSRNVFDSYDEMGRPERYHQSFWAGNPDWGTPFTVGLTYNKAGGVTEQTYPSGRTVGYQYDAAGRLGDNGAQPAFEGTLGDGTERTYASQVLYDELGGLSQERYGTQTPVYNKHFYNARGQLSEVRVSTHPITSTDPNLKTNWNRGALINHYSEQSWAGSGTDNNGNLRKQDVYIPADDQVSGYSLGTFFYDYDALNRLSQAREGRGGADQWVQRYDYDRWGNRTINAATWGAPEPQYSVDATTNRLGVPAGQAGAMGYDPAGNLTLDTYQGGQGGGGTRAYDAENRMTSAQFVAGQAQTAAYVYDADGRRVKRMVGTSAEVWQVYGPAGELLAEYAPHAAHASPLKEYGYRGG